MADSKKDLIALHYLRGVCAAGVMFFHYTGSAFGRYKADDFLGKFGVYAVSIFYILSGITLFHVYFHKWKSTRGITIQFYLKRILRIYPLLWLSSIPVIAIHNLHPGFYNSFLYFSGLFAVLKWDYSINPVGWSIGNELFFYSLFPLLVWMTKKSAWLLTAYVLLFAGVFLYFAFELTSPQLSLPEQWRVYTNPLNQYFLFLAGFAIAYLGDYIKITNRLAFFIMGALVILFILIPAHGDPGTIISGYPRLIYSFISIGICVVALKMNVKAPGLLHKALYHLGNISYAVYMLHPVVWIFLDDYYNPRMAGRGLDLSAVTRIYIAIPVTLLLSSLSYAYFEMPFMNLAKRKAQKSANKA